MSVNLFFWRKDEGGVEPVIKYVGIPAMAASFGILGVPGFSAATIHWLDKYLGLHLNFDQSNTAGWVFLVVGLVAFVSQGVLSVCKNSPFIALKHTSFVPVGRKLERGDLPTKLRGRSIEELDCDLYTFMNVNPPELEMALRFHSEWAHKAQSLQSVLRSAPIGYYGVVHVPFQFLAGYMVSTFVRVHFFELDRTSGKWKAISSKKGPSLSIGATVIGPEDARDVAIRISVSYSISSSDIAAVLPQEFLDAHLYIGNPRIDAVTAYDQIEAIASRFRALLDDPRIRAKTKHVFYAGPVSLGFALGQRISSTIHGTVNVYNFNSKSPVRYPWSVTLAMQEQDVHVRRF